MEPVINLEETIGKTVGHRRPPDPLKVVPGQKEAARKLKLATGVPAIPKGVYRFRTHEEADAWMWKMLTRRRTS